MFKHANKSHTNKYLTASLGLNVILLFVLFALVNCYIVFRNDARTISVPKNRVVVEKAAAKEVDQSFVFYSPDRSKKIYLEKEYDRGIQRFVRQTVVLEDIARGEKKILKESKLTPEQALETYTPDGCKVENGVQICCNSKTDFNQFEPRSWTSNDMVLVDEIADNYECAGAVVTPTLYSSRGEEYLSAAQKKQLDFTVPKVLHSSGFEGDSFQVASVCPVGTTSDVDLILKKNMFGGYSIARLSADGRVISQYLQTLENPNILDDLKDCELVGSSKWLKKYFAPKSISITSQMSVGNVK
jgi:hypothetical protein